MPDQARKLRRERQSLNFRVARVARSMAMLKRIHPTDAAERLTLLLESTREGIFGVDTDGRCAFVNRAAAQLLGRRTEEVLGRNMHSQMHHTHADGRHYPECDCPIFNACRCLPCRSDGEVLCRADGSCFPAEYNSHPVVENGQVQGAAATFVDITERKRAEELQRKSHEELELRVAERTRELRDLANHLEAVRETERKRIAHGFRSTFRDWVSECTNYPGEVAEMALAHTVGDKVEAAYRRGDLLSRQIQLMQDWECFLGGKAWNEAEQLSSASTDVRR